MLRIRIEKTIEGLDTQNNVVHVPAGSYEQTFMEGDQNEIDLFRKIIALVNKIKVT